MNQEKYKGWPVYTTGKGPLKVCIAPGLGGRILQMTLDGYDFLFTNDTLEGKENIQPTPAFNGVWQNFGGEKVWPAPQGWDNRDQWPGPPDPVLDGGIYDMRTAGDGKILLTSPVDNFTGLQIRREIQISDDFCGVEVKAWFENKSQTTRRWSIWPVIQMNTVDEQEDICRVSIPLSKSSVYESGYKIMHGLVNNPQFHAEGEKLAVDYKYLIAKVGVDSDAGWVAYNNHRNGKVFVAEFEYEPGGEYPEQTSVQVWTQGRGMIYSRGVIRMAADDRVVNPAYLEIELLSPFREMVAGGKMEFCYRMKMCTVPCGEDIVEVGHHVVVTRPLEAIREGKELTITGHYGFFTEGSIRLKDAESGKYLTSPREVNPCRGERPEYHLSAGECAGIKIVELELTINNEKKVVIGRIELCRI